MFRADTHVLPAVKAFAFFLCLIPLLPFPLQAQEASNRQDLERDIRVIDKLLAETKNRKERTSTELAMLSRQIELRERLLLSLTSEIYEHEHEIGSLDDQLCDIEDQVVLVKNNYTVAVRTTFRYIGSDNIWLSILSSGSLSEAYYRIKFYRKLTEFRERQLLAMEKAKVNIAAKQQQLSKAIVDKEKLWEDKKLEMLRLKDSREIQESVMQVVQRQEVKHKTTIEEQRQFLQETLRKSETGGQSSPSAPQPVAETAELDYGTSFKRSRGELPWPLRSGGYVVVQEFGEQEDVYGNKVQNDGLQIRTTIGEEVMAIHSGVVTGIQRVPNGGSVIIVAHGKYRTVYAGLGRISVSSGQTVAQGQSLGVVRTDDRTGESVLQFMIYQEPSRFLNPNQWLSR
ncbi:MAG: peptidoglycan DD-metalloendopeptidase family protein [Bacteroidia bacterium]|nr:peptidoglycan DD-metalloendopeptidase family protein [Bacteroidia bacterium]